jgi:hypothetical protein
MWQLHLAQPLDAALQQRAVNAIVTLLMFMMQHCSGMSVNLRQPDFVLGLLDLLRCGVRVFLVRLVERQNAAPPLSTNDDRFDLLAAAAVLAV